MTDSTFRSLMAMAYGSLREAMESMSHALNAANTEEDWCLETIRNGMIDAHIQLRMADNTVMAIRDKAEKNWSALIKRSRRRPPMTIDADIRGAGVPLIRVRGATAGRSAYRAGIKSRRISAIASTAGRKSTGIGGRMTYITIDNEDYTMRSTMTVSGSMQDVDKAVSRALHAREPDFKQGGLWCPACHRRVFNREVDAWCGHCGQRVKWE